MAGIATYSNGGDDWTRKLAAENKAAKDYEELADKLNSPDEIANRKKRASGTALSQAQNLAGERLSKAQSAARKQGMSAAQAAMYGGASANQNLGQDYQNAYNTNLQQENESARQALDAAKTKYDIAYNEFHDYRDFGLGVASTILGILSDEQIKVIVDKWKGQRRK
jgi:DNA-binding helix-hairpin-helix protein with protein kinase domain